MKKTNRPLKKKTLELVSISCILLLLLSLISFTALADNARVSDSATKDSKISTKVSSKVTGSSSTEKIPVIILLADQTIPFNNPEGKTKIDNQQKNLRAFLEKSKSTNKAEDIKPIKIVNAVAAKVTPDIIDIIANLSEVSKIEYDEIASVPEPIVVNEPPANVQDIAWGVDKIGAPLVWQQGITGKGITVAVIDTGIDATHPDLASLPNINNPKVTGWIDYVNGQSSPYDDNGHGTHVSGVISGTGTNGVNTGVAPGTNLIVAKVLNQNGGGNYSNIILGFEWAVTKGANIISFSGGGPSHYSPMTTVIDNVVAAGVIPVIAAGNYGPASSTIVCPGDEFNSVTIGATDSSDMIASFSSRGPVSLKGKYIKPDISAPGVDIISTLPDSSYGYMSGTSMAAPYVSGTIALMLQNNPTMKPSAIKSILENTAMHLGASGKNSDYGSGRINATAAVFSYNALPIANFSSNVTSGAAPLSVKFTDMSNYATAWNWDFGDRSTSIDQNPLHQYTKAGTYTVSLNVKNNIGSNTKNVLKYITVNKK